MAYLQTVSTTEAVIGSSCLVGQRDYWNLDDILAEEEHVPCVFKFEAKGLGYLD